MQAETAADVFCWIAVDITFQWLGIWRFAFSERCIERDTVELAGDRCADGDTDAKFPQLIRREIRLGNRFIQRDIENLPGIAAWKIRKWRKIRDFKNWQIE